MSTLFDRDEPAMKIGALASWFGSNRMLGAEVGKLLAGCSWVGVPFGGGLSEIPHIKALTIVVSDLHRHILALAEVIKKRETKAMLVEKLDAELFHPDTLADAQGLCIEIESKFGTHEFHDLCNSEAFMVKWAAAYFVCSWMGRSANAGTDSEFKGNISTRWTSSGGDSNKRYRSAVEGIEAWHHIAKRCNFVGQDVFEFLENVKDEAWCGVYEDSPFPGPGDRYKHKFTLEQHKRLAKRNAEFSKARIVCRFYDVPLIRELYPETHWKWHYLKGRDQANQDHKPEVLLVRNGV